MRQRLLLAMALINNPRILFLDEPTTGLDVQSTRLIRSMIRKFCEDGVGILLTTHNMEEAAQLCDRVAIIQKGRIIALDRPEKLRMRIRHAQSVEVSFEPPPNIEGLKALPGVLSLVKMGDRVRLYTEDPGELICHLVDYAKAHDLRLVSLNTLRPSLEEVFIRLTEEGG